MHSHGDFEIDLIVCVHISMITLWVDVNDGYLSVVRGQGNTYEYDDSTTSCLIDYMLLIL